MFEHLIRSFDANARIYYFKSFSRARVDLDSVGTAIEAKRSLHGLGFGQRLLECYFFRVSARFVLLTMHCHYLW